MHKWENLAKNDVEKTQQIRKILKYAAHLFKSIHQQADG